jgi:hypothetical protein
VLYPKNKIMRALTDGQVRASGYFTHKVDGNVTSEWSRYLDEIPVQFWEARDEIIGRCFEPEMHAEDNWTDDWANCYFSNEQTGRKACFEARPGHCRSDASPRGCATSRTCPIYRRLSRPRVGGRIHIHWRGPAKRA